MEITTIALIVVSVVCLAYGILGLRIVFEKSFARGLGGKFRKFYGVTSTGGLDEQIYDRYTRGVPAIMVGFGVAFLCIRALLA